MIPIQLQPEPDDFDHRIRRLGAAFLESVSNPAEKDWEGKEYWRRAIPNLKTAYNRICAYSSLRIIPIEIATVDHFIPRSQSPKLAYEWDNFRLARHRINTKKGVQQVLDPFKIEQDWFVLDFITFMVNPNPNLPTEAKDQVEQTIKNLGLNHRDFVDFREEVYADHKNNPVRLKEWSPFIAYEMVRQGLHKEKD